MMYVAMSIPGRICAVVASSLLLIGVAGAIDRVACEERYAPQIGQSGKDVIWVPTADELAIAMLRAANTTPDDFVIDLGAGDGKLAITAAKEFGARALGIEYNTQLVKLARCYVAAEGLSDRVEIREGDIFEQDFSEADVLTLYLLSGLNLKLRPTILQMRPGTRVVSNTFEMGDWRPDELIEGAAGGVRAYLWYVPANIAGEWAFAEQDGADRFRLRLSQRYQELEADLVGAGGERSVRDVTLQGAQLRFALVEGDTSQQFEATVNGETMTAIARGDGRTLTYVGQRE